MKFVCIFRLFQYLLNGLVGVLGYILVILHMVIYFLFNSNWLNPVLIKSVIVLSELYNLYNNKINRKYTYLWTKWTVLIQGLYMGGGGGHISCPSSSLLQLTSLRTKARNIISMRVRDSHSDLRAVGLMRWVVWKCNHSRCILLTNNWKWTMGGLVGHGRVRLRTLHTAAIEDKCGAWFGPKLSILTAN